MTYMLNDEWEELEGNFQGESSNFVLEYFDDIHTFITRMCLLEKLPQSCISTAMVIFHKYFLFKQSFENEFEKYLTCATCIFISVKACNQLTPLKDLVKAFIKLYSRQRESQLLPKIDDAFLFDTREKILMTEFAILDCFAFDLNIDLPYKYIHLMKPYYTEYLKNQKLIIITTNFINDSFKLPLCIYYDPLLIALASLFLVSVYFKIILPDTSDGVKWYQVIQKSAKLETIVDISKKINSIYKFCNENKSAKDADHLNSYPVIKFGPSKLHVNHNNVNGSILDVNEGVQGSHGGKFPDTIL